MPFNLQDKPTSIKNKNQFHLVRKPARIGKRSRDQQVYPVAIAIAQKVGIKLLISHSNSGLVPYTIQDKFKAREKFCGFRGFSMNREFKVLLKNVQLSNGFLKHFPDR